MFEYIYILYIQKLLHFVIVEAKIMPPSKNIIINNGLTLNKTILTRFQKSQLMFSLLKTKDGKRVTYQVYMDGENCLFKTDEKVLTFTQETLEEWYAAYKEEILTHDPRLFRSGIHDASDSDIMMIQFCIMLALPDTGVTREIMSQKN